MSICSHLKTISTQSIVKLSAVKVLGLVCMTLQRINSVRRGGFDLVQPIFQHGFKRIGFFPVLVIFLLVANGVTLYLHHNSNDVPVYHPASVKTRVSAFAPLATGSQFEQGSQEEVISVEKSAIREVSQPLSTNDLIVHLKQFGLWDLDGKNEVEPVIVPGFPVNLQHLDVVSKKRAFFHTLLPVAKVALGEIAEERQQLLAIAEKLPHGTRITATDSGWQSAVTDDERSFLLKLAEKYRSTEIVELLERVDGLPVSLILAQGAIESSWGTSRFATQGNNLFGVWTWGEKGMVPTERLAGKTHKVAIYESILDSVRDYMLTLNRHMAYNDLRSIRLQSADPLHLAEGLKLYSERGDEYISDVQMMIDFNKLQRFDTLQLAGQPAVNSLNS